MKILILISTLILSSCASRLPAINGIQDVSTSNYEDVVDRKTRKVEVYDGLYNKLTVQATKVDAEMTEVQSAYSAKLSQWSVEKYQQEKSKMIIKHSDSTEFFVSFFVPERKQDDLYQSKTTWKIYLEVNGARYEGKATKIKMLLQDVKAIYPFHNQWSTPYSVTFPVSTPATEGKAMVLTFTGPIATAQLSY